MSKQVFIAAANYAKATDRVATFNRKAAKFGQDLLDHEFRAVTVFDVNHNGRPIRKAAGHVLEFNNPLPRVAGHTLIATVEREGSVLLIETTRDRFAVEYVEQIKAATPDRCDHCHTTRARNIAYVLRNDSTDAVVVVGSSCVRDFLRSGNPEAAFAACAFDPDSFASADPLDMLSGGFCRGGSVEFTARHFLQHALAAVDLDGRYIPANCDSGKDSTKSRVIDALQGLASLLQGVRCRDTRAAIKERYAREIKPIADAVETGAYADQAAAVLDWGRAIKGENTFAEMVRRIAEANEVTYRTAGFACGMIPGYAKDQTFNEKREAEKQAVVDIAATNAHIGQPGERRDLQIARIIKRIEMDGNYGPFIILKMIDDAGRVVVFKGGRNAFTAALADCNPDAVGLTVKATIKSHDTYEGEIQTVINRPAVAA